MDETVYCEETDDDYPLFSSDELIQVRELQITWTQSEWITKECMNFPRLSHIVFLDNHKCPAQLCVPCM